MGRWRECRDLKLDWAGILSWTFLARGFMATPVAHTHAENGIVLFSASLQSRVRACSSTETTRAFRISWIPFLQHKDNPLDDCCPFSAPIRAVRQQSILCSLENSSQTLWEGRKLLTGKEMKVDV